MTTRVRKVWAVAAVGAAVAAAAGAAVARDLGTREARQAIARLLGRDAGEIRIKSISPGPLGGDAAVTVEMDVAFQLSRRDGDWRVASVRLADGRWEDVEALRRALDAEKARRADADLRALASGVEAYRRERGFYPEADSVAALVDAIAPRFTPRVIRVDPWDQPYFYERTAGGYRLGSPGPDGRPDTADDVVLASGGEGGTR